MQEQSDRSRLLENPRSLSCRAAERGEESRKSSAFRARFLAKFDLSFFVSLRAIRTGATRLKTVRYGAKRLGMTRLWNICRRPAENIILMVIIVFGLTFSLYADHGVQYLSSNSGDKPSVFSLNGTKVRRIYKSPSATQTSKPTPHQLIIAPGVYRFAGGSYNLQREGLYEFLLPEKMNLQRVLV